MKRLTLLILLVGAVLAPLASLHSQSAPPPVAAQPAAVQVLTVNIVPQLKAPLAQIQAIKLTNQAALDQQAKTLQALDELQKQAEELKTFAKRS